MIPGLLARVRLPARAHRSRPRAPSRRSSARAGVLLGIGLALAAMLGLSGALETVKPEWRDPEYGHRLIRLRQLQSRWPDRPLVLALGTSRTQNAIDPGAMGFPEESCKRFSAGEAPPSMAQVWTMYGLGGRASERDPLHAMMKVLTDAGLTGVLGTNCEQTYDRYLRVGEQVRVTTALEAVVGPKTTGMGEGYFVTSRSTWYVDTVTPEGVQSEKVASMLFRVLKFIPRQREDS